MIKILTYIAISLVGIMAISSCKSEDGTMLSVGEIKYVTAFPKKTELKATPIELGEKGMGTNWIVNIIDTSLILTRHSGPVYFEAYSTNTHLHIGSFINQGRGPEEYPAAPRILDSRDSLFKFCITDTYSGAIKFTTLHNLITQDTVYRQKYAPKARPGGANQLIFINNGLKIYNYMGIVMGRLGAHLESKLYIYKDSSLIQNISLFDFSDREEMPETRVLNTRISVSPKSNVLFCSFGAFNQINVYSLAGGENFTICYSPEKELYTLGKVEGQSRFSFKEFYRGATCSDQYLFALYYGYGRYKMEVEKSVYPVIHVFRHDGTPVTEFVLKEKLNSIQYDKLHNRLYGMTDGEEVFSYELGNVLE
ncbi:MAG: hypothetical protein RR555_10710 [Bacteroidales bacterium]